MKQERSSILRSVVDGVLAPTETLASVFILTQGLSLTLESIASSPQRAITQLSEKVGISPQTFPVSAEVSIASILLCGVLLFADGVRRWSRV